MNISIIKNNNSQFPAKLASSVVDAPSRLFVAGTLNDSVPLVAVVGSRKPSHYGQIVTKKIASLLAKNGVGVVSGLALGIDGLAHKHAINENGYTIAVLPGGLDRIYPASHRSLAKEIIDSGGALVTEYPPGTGVTKYSFPARNRIISGIADVVVIVEAAQKSGSLITAEHALDQGKLIMAVPGGITSPLSEGTNMLIANGAYPLTKPEDILDLLGIKTNYHQSELLADNPTDKKIIDLLALGPHNPQSLSLKLKLELAEVNRRLTHLEITGLVKNIGANEWIIS